MPSFRVYYAERRPEDMRYGRRLRPSGEEEHVPQHYETEWEEDIEAANVREALRAFFEEHLDSLSDLGYIDESGRTQRPCRMDDYDPDRTYDWMEGGKLMEYQGIEALDVDLVPCPICGGSGQVPRDLAREFEQEEGEEYEL